MTSAPPPSRATRAALEHIRAFEATRSPAQRRAGVVYTPPWLATALARAALGPTLARVQCPDTLRTVRVLDPACGAGALLLAALELLAEAHRNLCEPDGRGPLRDHRRAVLPCLVGADLDPDAIAAARAALHLSAGIEAPAIDDGPALHALDSLFDGPPGRCDVILANPPWGTVNRLGRQHPRQAALAARYDTIWQDKVDMSAFFVARATELTARSAWLLPSALLASAKGRRFRRWLAAGHHVHVFDAGERMLFPGAAVAAAALVIEAAGDGQPRLDGWRLEPEAQIPVEEALERFCRAPSAPPPEVWRGRGMTWSGALHGGRWHVVDEARRARWRAMDAAASMTVGERYRVGKGMETGCNAVFELPAAVLEGLSASERARFVRRRIRGVEIGALTLAAATRWLAWVETADAFESLPAALCAHLEACQQRLRARAAHRRGDCAWWRYTWPLHREAVTTRWRVISPYRASSHRFCAVGPDEGLGLTDTTSIFVDDAAEARALAALLMSAPVVDRFRGLTKRTGAGMMEFFENQLREIPLPAGWPRQVTALTAALEADWDTARPVVDAIAEAGYRG